MVGLEGRCWTLLLALILILGASSGRSQGNTEVRRWTSKSGETIEAMFVGFREGTVTLKTAAGERKTIRYVDLSQPDRDYIVAQRAHASAPDASSDARGPADARPARTWTSGTGNTIRASYVRMDGNNVILQDGVGRTRSIPLANFSAADQLYIQSIDGAPAGTRPKFTIVKVLGLFLFGIGLLTTGVGNIWLIVKGFQEGVIWGVCMLIFGFIASLFFAVMHWDDAKGPVAAILGGVLVMMGGAFLIGVG